VPVDDALELVSGARLPVLVRVAAVVTVEFREALESATCSRHEIQKRHLRIRLARSECYRQPPSVAES
jgi:hypothetical protein